MSRSVKNLALCLLLAIVPPGLTAQESPTFDWAAFHRANDQSWARRTGLSAKEIRKLRLADGIADDEPSDPLDTIDAKTLPRGRIVLVTAAGSGHCLTVNVFSRSGFHRLLSVSETPDGAGFCHPSVCRNAKVFAGKKNRIEVVVPVQLEGAPMGVCDENIVLTYAGKGKTYALVETKHWPAQCGLDAYELALQMAFAGPDDPAPAVERLVTVLRKPSFGPESAIAFEKPPDGLVVSRLAFKTQAWAALSILTKRQTPSQCIATAKALPMERRAVNISAGDVQRLLDELKGIDLNMDSCPRKPDGECAYPLDGTSYTVILEDGRPLRMTDVEGLKGWRSENPALSRWVTDLGKFVMARQAQ